MQVWLERLANIVPEEERALHAFYRQSVQTPAWSAGLGVELLALARVTPRDQWSSLPEFAQLGRLVIAIVRVYVEQLNVDDRLAWQLIRVGDDAMRAAVASYDHDDGQQMSSVLSWVVRDAVAKAMRRST